MIPLYGMGSPNAKVPVIVDSDGPSGKLLPADPAARFDAIQWLMTQMSTVGPMFGQFVHFLRFAPAGNDYSKSRYMTQAMRVTEVIDRRLAEHDKLFGRGVYASA